MNNTIYTGPVYYTRPVFTIWNSCCARGPADLSKCPTPHLDLHFINPTSWILHGERNFYFKYNSFHMISWVNIRIAHLRNAHWEAIFRWATLSKSIIRIAHPNHYFFSSVGMTPQLVLGVVHSNLYCICAKFWQRHAFRTFWKFLSPFIAWVYISP